MPRPTRGSGESPPHGIGAWTAMGIVKRLDDQKRMIDRICRELEELRSLKTHDTPGNAQVREFSALTRSLETALGANKRLAVSVIKIREAISNLTRENEKLREEINNIKRGSHISSVPVMHTRGVSDIILKMIYAVGGGARSSMEIARTICRSREHTSRMVKRMVQSGLLEAESQRYPARYVLTKAGRELLNSHTDPTSE